jgi:Protein of unknown function (DUF3137).
MFVYIIKTNEIYTKIIKKERREVNRVGLHDKMEALEAVRRKAEIGVVIAGIGVLVFLSSMFVQYAVLSLLGMGMIVAGVIFANGRKREYQALYKQLFAEEPLRANFDNVFYDWKSGFNEATVRSFQLCAMGNRFKSEDYLRASYRGINFEMSDVTVEYHTSNGKSSSTTVYFRGRMFAFDFPGQFNSSTRIYTTQHRYRGAQNTPKIQKVEMESVQFNKDFDVYSTSPHDAFYLLTPQYMEYLDSLSCRYPSMAIHFIGNKLFLGFNEPNKDVFDKKDWLKEASYPEEMEKVQRDIDEIKQVIDMFFV